MIRTYSLMHRTALPTQFNHFASLAKWLTARLWTKWLWVRVQLQSLPFFFFLFFPAFSFALYFFSFLFFSGLLIRPCSVPSFPVHSFIFWCPLLFSFQIQLSFICSSYYSVISASPLSFFFIQSLVFLLFFIFWILYLYFFSFFKAAVNDMRYFLRSTFSRCFVHKKKFGLICRIFFKLRYLFCQRR